jgi:Domain of unknown function DUF222./HNH endonuclease.
MFEGNGVVSSAAIEALDAAHAEVCRAQRRLLGLIVQVEASEVWRDDGARDLAHWLSMRYGISSWKAHRWISAAHALEGLPGLSEAFAQGELGIDKVVELTRFATPSSETGLISWAGGVSCGAIRHRGDLAVRILTEELTEVEGARSLSWWYFDEGRRFGLEAELPAAQGAIVARALARMADAIPEMPDEHDIYFVSARRADALVALCSARIATDADPDRATVVIHAQAEAMVVGTGGCEIEGGPVIAPETVARLLCNARSQVVVEDEAGRVLGLGRLSREPSAWMLRQVRHRDRECRFPGCGTRAFTEAHHIVFWGRGGRTDLENLVLICSFHHRLVHEYGWSMRRGAGGTISWRRPDGTRYRAGPSPGSDIDEQLFLVAAG